MGKCLKGFSNIVTNVMSMHVLSLFFHQKNIETMMIFQPF